MLTICQPNNSWFYWLHIALPMLSISNLNIKYYKIDNIGTKETLYRIDQSWNRIFRFIRNIWLKNRKNRT